MADIDPRADLTGPPPMRSDRAALVSHARLRRLFDASVVGIVISNNAGAILEANDAFLKMIGYTRDELDGGTVDWRDLTPPEWLHLDEDAIAQLAEHGRFEQYEKEYVRRDGTRVPVSLGGARITDTDDEQICYIVDLSAIRRTQAALRRSESRFARLADANVIGILTLRLNDGCIIEANDEFLRTVGYSRADCAAGRVRPAALTPPEWRHVVEGALRDLRAFGRFNPFEQEYFRNDGERVPVLVGGALLEDTDDEVVCYVLDLSDQKAAVLQLQDSERRYRMLAEALPQIVMLSDAQRRMIYVNQRYTDYTGIPLESVAQRWPEPIHPDDLPAIEQARASGAAYEIEYRLRRASDGMYRWHYARVMPIPGTEWAARWLATAIEIDDRKRAEEALQFIAKAGSRLSQSLDLDTTFHTLLDLVVPEFGDWASISLRDDNGRIKTIVARHADPAKADAARRLCGAYCFVDSFTRGTPAVYHTGAPQLLAAVQRDDVLATVDAAFIETFEELGYGSLVALPIVSGDDVIGSFSIVATGDNRRYSSADLPGLEELARRAGFAIANARLYEREHRVAESLQAAALPRSLPVVDGLRFDAFYQAGRQEAVIGGDWFDAHVVAEGRVVVSVGDVAGSGLAAAIRMGNVRQILRGAAHIFADPMMMLDVADRTLRSEHDNSLVTAFIGVIDPARATLLYASAGHLAALLRGADGRVTELHAAGLPLGCRDLGASESKTVLLPPGAALLLYTDGLVEWDRDIVQGLALLRERFAALDAFEAHPAKRLVSEVLPKSGPLDDVAALIVTVADLRKNASSAS